MNWFMVVGVLLTIVIIVYLVKFLTSLNEEKAKKPQIPIQPNTTEPKKSSGKIWNWIIPIVIISAIIGGILIIPKYYNKSAGRKSAQVNATVTWWKDDSVYGTNPDQRRSRPFDTKILRNDATVMNFEVYDSKNGAIKTGFFKGEKTSPGKIEGTWRQDCSQDGGNWYLKQDSNNPRLFIGKYFCITGEWINFKLIIDLD